MEYGFCIRIMMSPRGAFVRGEPTYVEMGIVKRLYWSSANSRIIEGCLQSKNVKLRMYKTLILSVVLYGCETWSLTWKEGHRLRVFENRVLRRIFWPKRVEVTGGWRKLHIEELHNLYSSPNQGEWDVQAYSTHGGERNACRVLAGKPEGKRPIEKPRRRWEYNIKMDLRELWRCTLWRNWLRHCATSQKVAGWIPNDVIGFFQLT
jgi:hypothetical protein